MEQKTLGEIADTYEQNKSMNISELAQVPLNVTVWEREGVRKDGTKFQVLEIDVDGKTYRVPKSVLADIKTFRREIPGLKYVRVVRQGTTKDDTLYTVIPLQDSQIKMPKVQVIK